MWVDRTLFVSPIEYGLCTSVSEFNALFPNQEFLAGKSLAETKSVELQGNIKILVCISPTTRHFDYLSLVHESVHVWQFIKEYIGEQLPGIEQEAYCIEAIVNQLIQEYDRQTTSKKKKKK